MTSETYLDLTFERSAKSGKRPIRPKLLKLTDVTMPHRSRKKTKVKAKDRSVSSVRDRIYDDPAYTDDISHLANPLRRNSCSGKSDGKAKSLLGINTASNVAAGGSSSLGKRSKLTKEFLQQGKLRDRGTAYEHDVSSSSDEPLRSESQSKSATGSVGRHGRSLERSAAYTEGKSAVKKHEKRERSNKQKGSPCLDSTLTQDVQVKEDLSVEPATTRSAGNSNRRSKTQSAVMTKQYSDGMAVDLQCMAEQAREEVASVHSGVSTTKAAAKSTLTPTTSTSGGSTKMQIGRRFLRGEIGIKSFNYYLLKEGIKSSKRFVERQRNSFTSGLAGMAGVNKKSHSRSEENIYEEIFFKDAPPSDEEQHQQQESSLPPQASTQMQQKQQQQHHAQHAQQHTAQSQSVRSAGTPISQCSGREEGIYADCELCLQQCTKEDCEYCYAQQATAAADSQRSVKAQRELVKPYAVVPLQQQQQQPLNKLQHQFDSSGGPLITQALNSNIHVSDNFNEAALGGSSKTSGNGSVGGQLPASHILEFQSYNPNNPGVFKIETTPVAITGDYNPILQFQQSSPSSGTATTTTPSVELQPQQQLDLAHHATPLVQHQQLPQKHSQLVQHYNYQPTQHQQQQFKHAGHSYLLHGGATLPHHHYHQSPGFPSNSAGILITQQRVRGNHRGGNQQQQSHYMLTYNTPPMATAPPTAGGGNQRLNTKSSSSSDSLQHQHMHKYNTMSRLEAQQMLMGDPFYGGSNMGPSNSLLFATSRPIGGSQILVDPYELPQMYKSDSRASILSEYSLRSSDNSHRYNRFRYAGSGGSFSGVAGGGGQVSDSSLGDSLFSCTSAQRRYFGSSESCRFGFECRRCSLDGGEKCSYSDTCRYECRNCDCSSSYFSSDFDDMYGSVPGACGSAAALAAQRNNGIPRKTAAGTLPASAGTNELERQQDQLELKQNKYAQDFFKHVNDVKRSIYQSEMKRNVSGTGECDVSDARGKYVKDEHGNVIAQATEVSPRRRAAKEGPQITTLPLTKERSHGQRAINASHTDISVTPTPAPRTSLQHAQSTMPPQPIKRARHAHGQASYKHHHEYPSLDRLVASATGAIPKTATTFLPSAVGKIKTNAPNSRPHPNLESNCDKNSNSVYRTDRQSPCHSPKGLKITDCPLGLPTALPHVANMDAIKVSCRETLVATEAVANNNNNNLVLESADAKQNDATKIVGGAKIVSGGAVSGSTKHEERYLSVEQTGNAPAAQSGKRHHRSTSVSKQAALSASRRSKDIPAPPPPSPVTHSDMQELSANLKNAQQQQSDENEGEAKKSSVERRREKLPKEGGERQEKFEEGHLKGEKEAALKRKKEKQAAELNLTQDSSWGSKNTTMKSPKSKVNASAMEKINTALATTITQYAGTSGGKELCETPTKPLAVAKSCVAAAVVVAGANYMPDSSTAMQQQLQQQQQNEMPPERAHAKPNNENSGSKNSSEAVKQLEVCTSAHATDDDDVFYDARSEDSGGTAPSAASSCLQSQQIAATGKNRSEQRSQCLQLRGKTASSPEFSREQRKPQQSHQQQYEQQLIVSSSDMQLNTDSSAPVQAVTVNVEDNATAIQTKSKDTLAATSESVKTERTKSVTTKSDEVTVAAKSAQAKDVTNVATNGATGSSMMALNLVEATAATVATAAQEKEQHKDVGGDGGANNSHTRREKKRRGTSSSNRDSSSRQHKVAAKSTTTISCDTCCQVECEQYHQQQQQKHHRHESRAESKIKTSKERANKIKGEKSRDIVEAATAPESCVEQSTITTTILTTKAIDFTKLDDSLTCAAAMLSNSRATAAHQRNELQTKATTTSTTTVHTTVSQTKLVTTTTIINQIGAQTDNISKSNENTMTGKGMSPQHAPEAVACSAAAAEQTAKSGLPSERNETTATTVGRGIVAGELSTTNTTTPTEATIIITPAEPTPTTITVTTITTKLTTVNDTAAVECTTVPAKLLTETAPSTSTSTPTAASDATAIATTSPTTSAANSIASCISDIAGVTTHSYRYLR
ncbi:uncharacterized protein LOC129242102 [Anastrepha obliqua]|uniref:uncharacterized protein LOC129242102 n=1 Tax=Anastrepha obliqua TaxID=95512 RepID=UPI002409C992|nr:uncharacterized protein LOC129242102 [Anastrepha obliqua]